MKQPNPSNAGAVTDSPVVLLVDDDRIFAATVRRMLASEGDISCHVCPDAGEALAMAARVGPTVILQDLVMHGADGLDLIPRYRAQEATSRTPLIVLSSEEDAAVKAEAFRRGANDYMVKPPHRVELFARVRYHSRAFGLLLREREFAESQRRADALRARDTLIFGLAKLAESRDTDTGEHLERIAAYCRVLAEELRSDRGLTDSWIRNLQLASSLHDIGKVGIPDRVLLKPGRLEPEERKEIERHPGIGADALAAILARDPGDELLRMALNIAASHHERWDGTGYPAGLRGDAIPFEARIVSVADVYDALTSPRVYKPALPHEEAMRIIVAGRGTQFDPAIIDAIGRCELVFRHAGTFLHGGDSSEAGGGSSR